MTATVTYTHVADADDVRQPFEWGEHSTGDGGGDGMGCWCEPETIGERTVAETDRELQRRMIGNYAMWGAYCTAVMETRGEELDRLAMTRHGLKRK